MICAPSWVSTCILKEKYSFGCRLYLWYIFTALLIWVANKKTATGAGANKLTPSSRSECLLSLLQKHFVCADKSVLSVNQCVKVSPEVGRPLPYGHFRSECLPQIGKKFMGNRTYRLANLHRGNYPYVDIPPPQGILTGIGNIDIFHYVILKSTPQSIRENGKHTPTG